MANSYGLTMVGPLVLENLSSLPTWELAYKGRVIYNETDNEIYIGGDPGALIAAYSIAKKKNGKLIYWSLELYIEKELNNFGLKLLKRMEKKINQHALFTLDFGKIRCEILQKENGLNPASMISIPNSQIGKGGIVRNYYFNEKFNIPRNKVIILHAGALYTPFLGVEDIIHSLPDWPDDYDHGQCVSRIECYRLHGDLADNYSKRIGTLEQTRAILVGQDGRNGKISVLTKDVDDMQKDISKLKISHAKLALMVGGVAGLPGTIVLILKLLGP